MVKPYRFKHRASILIILALAIFSGTKLSAQCIPDTANCKDIGNPGEFCPLDLPLAVVNVLYDEVVTVIPPGTFKIQESEVTILHIKIDSVKNMPPGIDYFPNADILYPDTAYCIQLTGTPTQAGEFTFAIYITAMVDLYGGIEAQVVDDSSIVITVQETAGIDPNQNSEFQVYQNIPNPFSEVTSLAYYTPNQEQIELSIFNILGVQVHQEKEWSTPGKHYFNFDGKELQPGTYLYRIKAGKDFYSGKILKSR